MNICPAVLCFCKHLKPRSSDLLDEAHFQEMPRICEGEILAYTYNGCFFHILVFSKWRSNNPSLYSPFKRQAHLQEVRLLQRGLQARGNGEMRWGTGIGARGCCMNFGTACVSFMVCNFWSPKEMGRF